MDSKGNVSKYKKVFAHFLAKSLINPRSPLSQDILRLMLERAFLNMTKEERVQFMKDVENDPNELLKVLETKVTQEDKDLISKALNIKLTKALINTSNSLNVNK